MKRRGRPRKYFVDGLDYGPIEAQIRHAERLGWPYRTEGNRVRMLPREGFNEKDAALYAQTWLATWYARGLITKEQYEAGKSFQSAAWRGYGQPFAKAFEIDHIPGYEDMDVGGAQRFTNHCKDRLAKLSSQTKHEVTNLCQYDRRPDERPATVRKVRLGLDDLADMMGVKKAA